jgi:glucose-1-phosphate thymidylyltransferase
LLECVHVHTALILATANPLIAAAPAPLDLPFLVPIANRPLLFHVIDDLVATGAERIVVGAPPVALLQLRAAGIDRERWPADLRYRVVPERADPVRALAAAHAAGALGDGPSMLHRADCRHCDEIPHPPAPDGPVDALLYVAEGEEARALPLRARSRADGQGTQRARWQPPPRQRLTGVQLLTPAAVDAACELAAELDGAIGIERLADRVAERGGRVAAHAIADCWRFGGRIDDVLAENRRVLERTARGFDPASLRDTTIHGAVSIHPTAQLSSTLVRGPVAIGAGAELSDAYVGPYTSIGAGAIVEGAEVENSIVAPGARLRNVGLRLEASVVGRDAEIARDFRLPRALHVCIGDRARVVLS